ncbi:MAG TPA: hypothetical protein VEQ35_06205 [Beijerinckia sp.]|jgi:hypothetical protein|nr:hypothetical protein [Beijerinckia sp.]
MSEPLSPLRARLERLCAQTPFLADLGVELVDCGKGWCEMVTIDQ